MHLSSTTPMAKYQMVKMVDMVLVKVELEELEYELEFVCGGYEYEYTVHCSGGAILSHEKEHHHGDRHH